MPHRRATTRADTSHAQGKARTNKRTRAAPVNSTMRQKQGNPATAPTRHSHGASRHRIRNQRHHAQQPHPTRGACSLAARNALITAQPQVKGNRPNTPHQGRAHPDDAESRPNMAETRKREKHTPRPPEQRRGSPNRQEHEPQRTAEESNPTHNHVSEPISSRTQQPCWITVQKRGNKHGKQEQRAKTRNKTRAPTATRKRTPQRHQPQGYTPQCRQKHAPNNLPLFTCFASPVPVARLELARPTGHPLLIDTPIASTTRFLRTRLA